MSFLYRGLNLKNALLIMLNIDELWIGDFLKVLKSGKIGSFEGVNKNGKIRLKVGKKIFLYQPSALEKTEVLVANAKLLELKNNELEKKLGYIKTEPSIDLHIEKLNKNLINALPERISDFQIKAAEDYIGKAIEDRLSSATIIHGKGAGVLKSLIHTLIQSYDEVNHFELINNGGATEIRFNHKI